MLSRSSVFIAAISERWSGTCALSRPRLRCRGKRYSAGLRRLGFGSDATLFYDEHVEADSVHEQIAVRELAGGLASSQPHRTDDILFGAAACLAFDDLLGDHLTSSWEKGKTSLRE